MKEEKALVCDEIKHKWEYKESIVIKTYSLSGNVSGEYLCAVFVCANCSSAKKITL
jgi:hypothetical protein